MARLEQHFYSGQNDLQRYERHVDRRDMRHLRQGLGLEKTNIGFLEQPDARVVTQSPVELAVADVDRANFGRAVGEQTVGKAARGSADVENGLAGQFEREFT